MPFDSGTEAQPGWTERSEYWLKQSRTNRMRRLRERRTEPLTLCGHGVHLRIERDTLFISNGFTHYPQERETFRFFRGDLNLPPRIVLVDVSGAVTFDVLAWLADQRVALIQLNWRGEVVTVAGGNAFAGDAKKVRWQTETRADPLRRLRFSIDLIRRKIAGSIDTLTEVFPTSNQRDAAVARLRSDLTIVNTGTLRDVTALRAVEARAGAAYFAAWRGTPIAFKSSARYPVPDAWRTIGPRSAVRVGKIAKNERATHPLNAMLNYAYAVLEGQLTIGAAAAGYDPSLGIMHHGYKGSAAYIFDLMEPNRPMVDGAVLSLAFSETFTGADFALDNDGSCRLTPQLARRVCALSNR